LARRPTKRRPRRRLRVDVDRSPTEIAKSTARQLDPTLTDEEIVTGLRELADQIEAESRAEVAS
jgi:hypothetical protein